MVFRMSKCIVRASSVNSCRCITSTAPAASNSTRKFKPDSERALESEYYQKSEFDKVDAGKQPKIVHGEKYEEWRKRWGERDGEWYSKFKAFSLTGPPKELHILKFLQIPLNGTLETWNKYVTDRRHIRERMGQEYIEERNRILGNDLALAHFICCRGGSISFLGNEEWITGDPAENENKYVPDRYVEGYFIEKVNCEHFANGGIRFEGLDNFRDLIGIKWLSFKGNKFFDDWCLDRMATLNLASLEYLDLSETSVSHRGLVALARMPSLHKLKYLILTNRDKSDILTQAVTILEYHYPNLLVHIKE